MTHSTVGTITIGNARLQGLEKSTRMKRPAEEATMMRRERQNN